MSSTTVRGHQQPRFHLAPASSVGNRAESAIELCAEIGMPLDEWQQIALKLMLGEEADGSWSAQEFGLICARQNGKNAVLEARELAGLFLFDEQRIVHSAHQAATAAEAFKRMVALIESTPWLEEQLAPNGIVRSPGRQAIRLKSGAELSYRTRTKGGGRGFSAAVVILDEAQELTGEQLAAIMPLISSFHSRQLIQTGTVLAGAAVFHGLVERGRQGIGDRLGYAEWSAPETCSSDDVEAMLAGNPSIGIRIDLAYVQNELNTFRAAGEEQRWREERLSIWPTGDELGTLIPVASWEAAKDASWAPPAILPRRGYSLAIAVAPDRSYSSIAMAMHRPDGRVYVEVVEHKAGVDWVLPWVDVRAEQYRQVDWVIDGGGPAAALQPALASMKVPVRMATTADWKAACAGLVDDVLAGRIAHRGQEPLDVAAHGVRRRDIGEQWGFDRKKSGVLIAPIEAIALARLGLHPDPKSTKKPAAFAINLNDFA